ncbi:hypothetical protein [Streptomyces phaeochromogenes]|uniref:hypothetical protein n=1 Tax=Streptomyces phaeochromogenes TaxID=1923 RepID=UPI00386EE37F|nr:hypothetical protein OG277_15895 [Streptomyces phaeochromogenes]
MASVMGLLEEREAAARVRVEELQAEADRILSELAAAEAVLERRAIARVELAEALAAPGDAAEAAVQEAPEPVTAAKAVKVPVAGSIVPHFGEGTTVESLAPGYRLIEELVESGPQGGEGVSAKEIASGLGLELVPAKIEGVRSKARRLAERGWLAVSPAGRFTPRQPTVTVPAAAGKPGGRGDGS